VIFTAEESKLGLENQLDSTQNSSYFSLSFRHWDCTANCWELRGQNLQFNIQPRLAIFSKWSTIHITRFLGDVFESAVADNYKWPKVTRRITWSCVRYHVTTHHPNESGFFYEYYRYNERRLLDTTRFPHTYCKDNMFILYAWIESPALKAAWNRWWYQMWIWYIKHCMVLK